MAVAAFTSSCDSICIDWACLLGAAGMHGTCSPAAASRRLKKGNRVGFGRLFLPTEDSTGVVGSLPELLTRQLLKLNKNKIIYIKKIKIKIIPLATLNIVVIVESSKPLELQVGVVRDFPEGLQQVWSVAVVHHP